MTDRIDWPTLVGSGYDQAFTPPKHPKPDSLRARVSFYESHIDLGIPLPCCYLQRSGAPRHFLTGYKSSGNLYYATFAYNQSVDGTEADSGIEIYLFDPIVQRIGDFRSMLTWSGWSWNRIAQVWVSTDYRINQTGGKFPYASDIDRFFSGPTGWEPFWSAGIQCYLSAADWQPSDLPGVGPPKLEWPPAYDTWWIDQF